MAAIRPFLTVEWGGTEYRLTATMAAINEIEGAGVNPVKVAMEASQGNPMRGQLATVYAVLLRHAGCSDVTAEDVYAGMFGGADVDSTDVLAAAFAAINLIFPPSTGGEAAKKKLPRLVMPAKTADQ